MALNEQQIIDGGMNIFRDSKRRQIYLYPPKQTTYLIKDNEKKWIRFYELRYVVSVIMYFITYLISARLIYQGYRPLLSLFVGLVGYGAVTLIFEYFIIKKFTPVKVKEIDLNALNDIDIFKQKRSLIRYSIAFTFLYGLIAIIDLWLPEISIIAVILTVSIIVGLLILLLIEHQKLHKQIKNLK